jgi:hypothetical protein
MYRTAGWRHRSTRVALYDTDHGPHVPVQAHDLDSDSI